MAFLLLKFIEIEKCALSVLFIMCMLHLECAFDRVLQNYCDYIGQNLVERVTFFVCQSYVVLTVVTQFHGLLSLLYPFIHVYFYNNPRRTFSFLLKCVFQCEEASYFYV